MASLSDILTATKNIVTALNQLGQTYLQVQGLNVYSNITTNTVVLSGQGRVVRMSVIVAGSSDGSIYDANVATATTNKLVTIEKTIGVYEVNMPVNNGIVVHPGTGQTISISYS